MFKKFEVNNRSTKHQSGVFMHSLFILIFKVSGDTPHNPVQPWENMKNSPSKMP